MLIKTFPSIVAVDGIPFAEYIERQREHDRATRAHWTALRRARLRQRSVKWADRKAIEKKYIEAARLTQETGVPHHVDHIVPLIGNGVSGLHVEFNLQVITAAANMQKGNR